MLNKNSEKRKEYSRRYYLKHKEKVLEKVKKYNSENQEKRKEINRKHYIKHKEKVLKKNANYREKNKEKVRAHDRWRAKNNINRRFSILLRRRIILALKRNSKSANTITLLGIQNIEELWTHLEKTFKPGMTRENHGLWHIDHIKPCSSFDLSKPEEQAKCFHHTNLQALWAHENLSKSNKIL
jgi:hypothetical protein